MIAHEILPQPASTYQLLLDAARTWPDSVATQWIPDPGDYTRRVTWTYTGLAGTATGFAGGPPVSLSLSGFISAAICSRFIGPRRNDSAQRLWKTSGLGW